MCVVMDSSLHIPGYPQALCQIALLAVQLSVHQDLATLRVLAAVLQVSCNRQQEGHILLLQVQ